MENQMGKAIKYKRRLLGYSQQELGNMVGRTPSQIGQIERGITKPSVEVLTKIVDVLSLDANMMFSTREVSDELKDSMIMLEKVNPVYKEFILDIIRMAYKQTKQETED